MQFVFGGLIGYGMGKLAVWILNRIDLKNASLYPILLLTLVFFTFTVTDLVRGNGYLAVYLAGIVVGNARVVNRRDILRFFDGLTWLFQIVMFHTAADNHRLFWCRIRAGAVVAEAHFFPNVGEQFRGC